jgi:hypothetical protein
LAQKKYKQDPNSGYLNNTSNQMAAKTDPSHLKTGHKWSGIQAMA